MTAKSVAGLLTLIGLLIITAAFIWWLVRQPWDRAVQIAAIGAVVILWGGFVHYVDQQRI